MLAPLTMCGVSKRWTAERFSAVVVKDAPVASVYAPDFGKMERVRGLHEKKLTSDLLGAATFYHAGDLNVHVVFDAVTEEASLVDRMCGHVGVKTCTIA